MFQNLILLFFARCVTTILSLPVEFVLTIFRSVPIPYCRRRAMLSCSILSRCSLKRAIVSSQDSNCRPSTFCLCFVRATVRSSETTILYSETNRCPPPSWTLLQCCDPTNMFFLETKIYHTHYHVRNERILWKLVALQKLTFYSHGIPMYSNTVRIPKPCSLQGFIQYSHSLGCVSFNRWKRFGDFSRWAPNAQKTQPVLLSPVVVHPPHKVWSHRKRRRREYCRCANTQEHHFLSRKTSAENLEISY